jgi:hypothetical protein
MTNSSKENYFPVRYKNTEQNPDIQLSNEKFSYESVAKNNVNERMKKQE